MRTSNPRVPESKQANDDVVLQSFYQQRKNRTNSSTKCHSLLQKNTSYFSNSLKHSSNLKEDSRLQSYPSLQVQIPNQQNMQANNQNHRYIGQQTNQHDRIKNAYENKNIQIQTVISRVRAYSQKSTAKNTNQFQKQVKPRISQRQKHIQQLQNSFKALTAGMPSSNKNKKLSNVGNFGMNRVSLDVNNIKNSGSNINGMIMQKLQKYVNNPDIGKQNSKTNDNINIINQIKPNPTTNKNSNLFSVGKTSSISPSNKSSISISKYIQQYNQQTENSEQETMYKQNVNQKRTSPIIHNKYDDQDEPLVVLAATNKQKQKYNQACKTYTYQNMHNLRQPNTSAANYQQQYQLSMDIKERQIINSNTNINKAISSPNNRFDTHQQSQDMSNNSRIYFEEEYQSPNFKMNQQSHPDQQVNHRQKTKTGQITTVLDQQTKGYALIKQYNTDPIPTFNPTHTHQESKPPKNKKQKTNSSMNSNKSSATKQLNKQRKIVQQQKQQKFQQQIEYLKGRVDALEKINKKQSKFIESVQGMRKIILQVNQDCNLKQLWRWLKALPSGKNTTSQEKNLDVQI